MIRSISTYRGYAHVNDRILTDQLIKRKIQDLLLYSKDNLFKVVQHYYKKKNVEKSNFVDSICTELDLFRSNIKNSEFGFHPKSQSLIKERKEDYENIIKADASLIYYVDEISKVSSRLQLKALAGDNIQSNLFYILENLKILKEIFQKRKDYITGVAQVLEIKEIKMSINSK